MLERFLIILLYISPILFLSLFAREYRLREAKELTDDYLDEVLSYGISFENYEAYEEALKTLKFKSDLMIYGKNARHYTNEDLYSCLFPYTANDSVHLSAGSNNYTLAKYAEYKNKGFDCVCLITLDTDVPVAIDIKDTDGNIIRTENISGPRTFYMTTPNLTITATLPTIININIVYEPRITPSYLDFYTIGILNGSDDPLMLIGRTMYSNIKY